jgi:hypothetical protein
MTIFLSALGTILALMVCIDLMMLIARVPRDLRPAKWEVAVSALMSILCFWAAAMP